MAIRIQTPLTDDAVRNLKAGEEVLISGFIYTARDAAHKRMMQGLDEGIPLPFEMAGQIIYYVGPCPAPPGKIIGSAGPTTSGRMDSYTPRLLDMGLKGMIGKGLRNDDVVSAMKRNGAVYFGAIGGAAALIARSVVQEEIIAFPELGTEAVRRLSVRDFPAFVVIDVKGNNFYEIGRAAAVEQMCKMEHLKKTRAAAWIGLFGPARLFIFAGHYGSGKSEISVQFARALAASGKRVLMADMDIVNPFFRSLDARAILETEGIRVAAPLFANTNVDVPALVPEVSTAMRDPAMHVVLDVGGDGDGARVLGRYHRDIDKTELAMVFVFNASRPMTRNAETAAIAMEEIEFASRQHFTHILNNTHLMDETTCENVQHGEREALRLMEMKGCPLAASVMAEGLQTACNPSCNGIPWVPLQRTLGVSFG